MPGSRALPGNDSYTSTVCPWRWHSIAAVSPPNPGLCQTYYTGTSVDGIVVPAPTITILIPVGLAVEPFEG